MTLCGKFLHILQGDEEKELAVIFLQKLLRGRSIQNQVHREEYMKEIFVYTMCYVFIDLYKS